MDPSFAHSAMDFESESDDDIIDFHLECELYSFLYHGSPSTSSSRPDTQISAEPALPQGARIIHQPRDPAKKPPPETPIGPSKKKAKKRRQIIVLSDDDDDDDIIDLSGSDNILLHTSTPSKRPRLSSLPPPTPSLSPLRALLLKFGSSLSESDLISCLPVNADWSILPDDYRRSKRFKHRCRICHQLTDHRARVCPKLNKRTCHVCASPEHSSSIRRPCPMRTCMACLTLGHRAEQCPKVRSAKQARRIKCVRCGERAHLEEHCPMVWQKTEPKRRKERKFCYNCGRAGHWGHECLKRRFEDNVLPFTPSVA